MDRKKFVFGYFGQQALCTTPQEAVAFINSLTYHNNGKDRLVCNADCERKIQTLFASEQQPYWQLKTTGCGPTFIKVCPPLADTLEEHVRLSAEKEMQEEAIRIAEDEEKLKELQRIRPGKYFVQLSYNYCRPNFYMFHSVSYYEKTVMADSGLDAYRKVTAFIEKSNTDKCVFFPGPRSGKYSFEFLSECKTDTSNKRLDD